MDIVSWEKLTIEQQKVFEKLEVHFIQSVLTSRAKDGFDFEKVYHIEKQEENYVITDGNEILGDIKHPSETVIRALFTEAVQNYGR